MIIVGLAGGIGHGKTTFAEQLASYAKKHRHWEAWEMVAEVASTLRRERPEHPSKDNIAGINSWLTDLGDIIATCMHTPADFTQLALTDQRIQSHPEQYAKLFEYLDQLKTDERLQTEDITPETKQLFRSFLQWLGGYLVINVDDGIWFDEIIRRIRQSQKEGLELATVGGVRFPGDAERLRNAGAVIVEIVRPGQDAIDTTDITERERKLIKPDARIINDSSLENLRACAGAVHDDLLTHELKPEYKASLFSAAA